MTEAIQEPGHEKLLPIIRPHKNIVMDLTREGCSGIKLNLPRYRQILY